MKLEDFKIILASGSPRRIKMLQDDGQSFEICKPNCEENICTKLNPQQTVMALALRKGLNVKQRIILSDSDAPVIDNRQNPTLIIACDTIVAFGNQIIGKPSDEEDAFRILSLLNGQEHQVWSGICLIGINNAGDGNWKSFNKLFACPTDVFFKKYTNENIRDYIASGEPMDKAGAYAIQGEFGKYIDHIRGDYNNVVGFPYDAIKQALNNL